MGVAYWKVDNLLMLNDLAKSVAVKLLSYSRFIFMLFQMAYMLFPSRKTRIFNLDLHTSLIADLGMGFRECEVLLISWNLSGNNRNFRKFFKIKDPVYPFTKKMWTEYDQLDFDNFRRRYKFFLSRFDGFVVCFPPAFLEIFASFGKPVLVNIGTRYEGPYTRQPERWKSLNEILKSGISLGQVTVIANNIADADYLNHYSGILPAVVPSLCDYTGLKWKGGTQVNLLFCRNKHLARKIVSESGGQIIMSEDYLGKNWKYKDLININSVTVIPYNISTMSLLEFASAGIPVRIPSSSLLLKLHLDFPDILNEVSFLGAWGLEIAETDDELQNYKSVSNLRWWLERADFYQSELMPNVQIYGTFSELTSVFPVSNASNHYTAKIDARNTRLSNRRTQVVKEFLEKITSFDIK